MSLMLSSLHSVHSALIYDRISFYTHFPHIFLYTHFYGQPAENANYNNYVRYFPFGLCFFHSYSSFCLVGLVREKVASAAHTLVDLRTLLPLPALRVF